MPTFSIPISGRLAAKPKTTAIPVSGVPIRPRAVSIAISGSRRMLVDPGASTFVVVVIPDRAEPYTQNFHDREGLLLFLRDAIKRHTVYVFRGTLCEIQQQPDTARYYLRDDVGLLHELGPKFDETALRPVVGPANIIT